MRDETLEAARAIHEETGPTFYAATRLLPERVRAPTVVLYAFFRRADEVVDGDNEVSLAEQEAELDRLLATALGQETSAGPIAKAVADVRVEHAIPEDDLVAFVDSMKADLFREGYATFAELRDYMEGSAAAVGRMMARVMGVPDEPAVLARAAMLGEAFQMTNFLRDVREDLRERGRVYLPQQTLDRFGVEPEDLREPPAARPVRAAIGYEAARTRMLYREGVLGLPELPADCQLPVTLAATLYAEHHRLLRDQRLDVIAERPTLSGLRRAWVAAKVRAAWAWEADPVWVFDRVAAIDMADPEPQRPVVSPTPTTSAVAGQPVDLEAGRREQR
jgi:phytoene synthase